MLSAPVRHDIALEAELAFHYVVQRLVVLTCISVVDEVFEDTVRSVLKAEQRHTVTAHDTSDTSLDTTQEGMRVKFMLSSVIDIRRLLSTLMLLLAVKWLAVAIPAPIKLLTC